jgi:hypothetical protein
MSRGTLTVTADEYPSATRHRAPGSHCLKTLLATVCSDSCLVVSRYSKLGISGKEASSEGNASLMFGMGDEENVDLDSDSGAEYISWMYRSMGDHALSRVCLMISWADN